MIDVITNIFLFIEVIESPKNRVTYFRQKNNNKNNKTLMKVGMCHHGPTIKIVVYSLILGEHKLKKT